MERHNPELRPIMPDIKCRRFPRTRVQRLYSVLTPPPSVIAWGLGMHRAELRGGATAGGHVIKSYTAVAIEMGERFGKD
jgi:hypothetical protein